MSEGLLVEVAERTVSEDVLFEVKGHVAYITLNRPRSLNAITQDMDSGLAECWERIDADPDIWVAVISAAGERAFCAGADISGGVGPHPDRVALGGGLTGIGGSLRRLRKPLVAVVQGYVLGGGFELAMCADIIIAADTTQFGLPEIKAGIIGECGVVHRAIRQLPHRVAMAMILTSERLPAADALHHGLVNEVVPFEQLSETTERWVHKLTAASPLAQQAAKEAVLSRVDHPLEVALTTKYELIEAYALSQDVAEGRQAFVDKRLPSWTGR